MSSEERERDDRRGGAVPRPGPGGIGLYELGGRQYLLVTASGAAGPGGPSSPAGPTGIIAYALPKP